MTNWKEVGGRIKARRESLGWTQLALGKRVGSGASYVNRVEAGLAISEGKLALYATALGLTVPFLRYGIADGVDVEAVREGARAQGREEMLAALRGWIDTSALDSAAEQKILQREINPSEKTVRTAEQRRRSHNVAQGKKQARAAAPKKKQKMSDAEARRASG